MSKVVNNAAVQAVESGTSEYVGRPQHAIGHVLIRDHYSSRITQNEATLRREAETQAAKVQEAVNDAAEVAQVNSTKSYQILSSDCVPGEILRR